MAWDYIKVFRSIDVTEAIIKWKNTAMEQWALFKFYGCFQFKKLKNGVPRNPKATIWKLWVRGRYSWSLSKNLSSYFWEICFNKKVGLKLLCHESLGSLQSQFPAYFGSNLTYNAFTTYIWVYFYIERGECVIRFFSFSLPNYFPSVGRGKKNSLPCVP